MAKTKSDKTDSNLFNKGMSNITDLLDQLSTALYGTNISDESDKLNDRFNEIMQSELNRITNNGTNSFDSFLGQLYNADKEAKRKSLDIISKEQLNLGGDQTGINPQDFITEQYKNRMLKQSDANQISNQLIELREAKEVMRDSIISADVNTGRITRNIVFENTTVTDAEKDYTGVIEAMEKKFDTHRLIKDFIVDSTLGYGTYYAYTIPYHELFNNFARRYNSGTMKYSGNRNRFFEACDESEVYKNIKISPIYESTEDDKISRVKKKSENDTFLESTIEHVANFFDVKASDEEYTGLKQDVTELVSDRITISLDSIPIPILEDGLDAYKELADEYITEDGDYFIESTKRKNQKTSKKDTKGSSSDIEHFSKKYGNESGFYGDTGNEKDSETFTNADIKDCYNKMIPPTRMLPVKILGQTLFYIYIQTDEATPLTTILSYTNQIKTKDPNNKITCLIDDIAERIVSKFNKSFVKENMEFRKLIVSALEYYDISNTRIHFQLIPKEYVTEFKVNTDIDGYGHSMLEPSLFYAKLYLMLLMFKIITILTKSNDEKINYIRTSGIDKNVFNKTQEIIRRKQGRRITLNDLFSYTSVINKVGSGSEIYMPLGKNGERPVESEILQGQDVQMNTDLMEFLRQCYILGTGVPSAIMNYLNEADFAKSIETANTKMNGRTINYQLDFNEPLTEWYHKLLRFSTTMPDEVIDSLRFILPEPKGSSNIATQEILNNYQTLQDFLVRIYLGENVDDENKKQMFLKELAKIHLPMINFAKIDEVYKKTCVKDAKSSLNKNDEEPMEL